LDDTRSIQVADLDGDGALDVVVGNSLQSNKVYINLGDGTFNNVQSTVIGTQNDDTRSIAISDLNADALLDVAVGNAGQQDKVYLSTAVAPGDFSTVVGISVGSEAYAADTRYIMTSTDSLGNILAISTDQSPRTYINPGDGNFAVSTATYLGVGSTPARALALGDVDSDSFLDVVDGNRLYLNPGSGDFSNVAPTRIASVGAKSATLGDVDGDVRLHFSTRQ
jgi:hypothetical protein